MKKFIFVLLFAVIVTAGCAADKTPVPKPDTKPDTGHLTSEQNGVTVEVSNELKTFPKSMIATKEGYNVVGISVIVVNNTRDNLSISPDYVTLVAMDNSEYKYSEITSITGKGAFKKVSLPPDYRGGGLLLFEIKQDVKIKNVIYKDEKNHSLTINFDSGTTSNI